MIQKEVLLSTSFCMVGSLSNWRGLWFDNEHQDGGRTPVP